MTRLPSGALASMLLRSFAVQATWNYRTLIGCGFAFALLPVLKIIYAARPQEYEAAVRRHTGFFNAHPYFAPMALGAVSVLEATESTEVIERFKSAVRGSLGSLGDRLIWAGFRPLCILLALATVLLGAGWASVTIGFLVIYNSGHVGARVWALRFGLKHGRRVGEQLRFVPVERVQHMLQSGSAFLLGLTTVMVLGGRSVAIPPDAGTIAAGAVAAIIGIRYAGRARLPLVLLVTFITLVGIAIGGFQ